MAIENDVTVSAGGAETPGGSPSDEDVAPGTKVGEYVIEHKLGEGGFGAVYRATHPLIGKVAALYVQRFDDPVALSAVDQIEDLTTGLSRKIWQKIMIIDRDRT